MAGAAARVGGAGSGRRAGAEGATQAPAGARSSRPVRKPQRPHSAQATHSVGDGADPGSWPGAHGTPHLPRQVGSERPTRVQAPPESLPALRRGPLPGLESVRFNLWVQVNRQRAARAGPTVQTCSSVLGDDEAYFATFRRGPECTPRRGCGPVC